MSNSDGKSSKKGLPSSASPVFKTTQTKTPSLGANLRPLSKVSSKPAGNAQDALARLNADKMAASNRTTVDPVGAALKQAENKQKATTATTLLTQDKLISSNKTTHDAVGAALKQAENRQRNAQSERARGETLLNRNDVDHVGVALAGAERAANPGLDPNLDWDAIAKLSTAAPRSGAKPASNAPDSIDKVMGVAADKAKQVVEGGTPAGLVTSEAGGKYGGFATFQEYVDSQNNVNKHDILKFVGGNSTLDKSQFNVAADGLVTSQAGGKYGGFATFQEYVDSQNATHKANILSFVGSQPGAGANVPGASDANSTDIVNGENPTTTTAPNTNNTPAAQPASLPPVGQGGNVAPSSQLYDVVSPHGRISNLSQEEASKYTKPGSDYQMVTPGGSFDTNPNDTQLVDVVSQHGRISNLTQAEAAKYVTPSSGYQVVSSGGVYSAPAPAPTFSTQPVNTGTGGVTAPPPATVKAADGLVTSTGGGKYGGFDSFNDYYSSQSSTHQANIAKFLGGLPGNNGGGSSLPVGTPPAAQPPKNPFGQ